MSAYEAIGKSDEWYTPKYVFDALGAWFDLDVSAPVEGPPHVPCNVWIHQKSLSESWTGFIWMNPPFGKRMGLVPWLDKFFAHGNGIALTPDRTSAPWWQDAARRADAMLIVNHKIKFERPDGTIGKSPGTGTTLFGVGEKAMAAFSKANGRLGLVANLCRKEAQE